ncbi:hypothetical protein ACE4RU_04530 [Actinobacillus seminis]|uniref:hypothetical protein n=1 Tax=Actinobacillus seminis TaxID=722 RepID=UPI003B94D007
MSKFHSVLFSFSCTRWRKLATASGYCRFQWAFNSNPKQAHLLNPLENSAASEAAINGQKNPVLLCKIR